MARTTKAQERELREREAAEAAARWGAADADARSRGWGGLVPGTGMTWLGLARMAHARNVAGLPLTDRDLAAIAKYPTMPDLIDRVVWVA